jgi:hypothetical protein
MIFDYKELEQQLVVACDEVHKDFLKRFNSDIYVSAGGAKLEAFINDLQKEFETVAIAFLTKNDLDNDSEAKKKALAITKLFAKKCIEDFSKI